MFRKRNGGEIMEWKDVKVSKDTWNLIRIRVTELTVKEGRLVTIREYIQRLVEKDVEGK